MGFERYVPQKAAATGTPQVTIRKSGLISFDGTAVGQLDLAEVSHMLLFFDKRRKLLGVKQCGDGEDVGALATSRRRRTVSIKAPEFFEHWGFILDDVQKLPVSMNEAEDLIIVDLGSLPRKRGRRASRSQ
jgi:hypothetical protein